MKNVHCKELAMLFMLSIIVCSLYADDLTGKQIMEKLDDVFYSAKDKEMKLTFILIDKNGNEKVRKLDAMEKGSDYRMMKFTEPADQRGIAFLSLPGEIMYLYLPAFDKIRRIASHIKNKGFAGTDLTYEDLESKRYSTRWNAVIKSQGDKNWVLKLTAMPKTESDYSKLYVTVRKDNFYPIKIEYFDKSGTNFKTMYRNKVEKIQGKYWEARETLVNDTRKQHKTKLIIEEIKYDSNIPKEKFSKRYLSR